MYNSYGSGYSSGYSGQSSQYSNYSKPAYKRPMGTGLFRGLFGGLFGITRLLTAPIFLFSVGFFIWYFGDKKLFQKLLNMFKTEKGTATRNIKNSNIDTSDATYDLDWYVEKANQIKSFWQGVNIDYSYDYAVATIFTDLENATDVLMLNEAFGLFVDDGYLSDAPYNLLSAIHSHMDTSKPYYTVDVYPKLKKARLVL